MVLLVSVWCYPGSPKERKEVPWASPGTWVILIVGLVLLPLLWLIERYSTAKGDNSNKLAGRIKAHKENIRTLSNSLKITWDQIEREEILGLIDKHEEQLRILRALPAEEAQREADKQARQQTQDAIIGSRSFLTASNLFPPSTVLADPGEPTQSQEVVTESS
ncbi:MAG: hypothetical protein AAB774_00705 [Patescibacteria group bacterium]